MGNEASFRSLIQLHAEPPQVFPSLAAGSQSSVSCQLIHCPLLPAGSANSQVLRTLNLVSHKKAASLTTLFLRDVEVCEV